MSQKPPPLDDYAPEPTTARGDLVKGQEVSLGCGTLILIALIVMIFGNRSNDEIESELRQLRSEISEVKTLLQTQSEQLREMQQQLNR